MSAGEQPLNRVLPGLSVVHTFNPKTWEVEAQELGQGYPQLHSKLKASLDYMSPFLKKQRRKPEPKQTASPF